ncbi:ABC transporter ATP-binding protein [Sulfidibacter corallicola]|uniref:ABC transporter ATP-binding protein n=1 Tax=Sulfidibacter corallicola TaxID=2818388 RepID=A0A8A4U5K3_SULCO|nr:ATP-binding cassette domain-containing protein [Sulfidibacter corallicola]QTD54025.1 ABC transporter ATP-binding protein [Sulfidibacter corallicola]
MAALIEVENWGVTFGRRARSMTTCIRDIDFSLGAGEVLGIVGASGTGKSVTIQSLIGLYDHRLTHIHPDASVKLLGVDALAGKRTYHAYQKRLRPLLRGRVGMVFQDHRALMNPLKTVGQHFRDAARLAGIPYTRRRVQETLRKAGCAVADEESLSAWLRKVPRQLSGGEAQRVQIAISLLSPHLELLICDEVTSNLDTHNQWRIIRLLQRLHREQGIALLFISHDWDQIQTLSDRILVLRKEGNVGVPYTTLTKEQSLDEDRLRQDETISQLLPLYHDVEQSQAQRDREPLIEARDLRKSFHGREVLHGVSLSVYPGERYALIGESGSGKSTLARMILGVERMSDTSGDLRVMGRSRLEWDGYDSKIQMVFQNFSEAVNPYMTSGRHLEALLKVNPHGDRAEADDWMRDLGIEDCREKTTGQMSGGEKRRLGLVETFSVHPKLILADEPTAGLDKARQSFFLKKMEAYRIAKADEAVTEFMISHDLHLVGSYAERIGVLYSGHLVQEAEAACLLADDVPFLHPYSELLLRAKDLELDENEDEDEDDTPESAAMGCCYYAACHRRHKVNCEYRDRVPPRTEHQGGWSLCPYPV